MKMATASLARRASIFAPEDSGVIDVQADSPLPNGLRILLARPISSQVCVLLGYLTTQV